MTLYLISPDFENHRNWTFYYGDDKKDRTKLSCKMTDLDFLEKVKNTQIGYYDIFIVKLDIIQKKQKMEDLQQQEKLPK